MKLSTRVRFGLRIMAQIALDCTDRPVFSRYIAAKQEISEAYVDQILLPLRTGGLLVSQRGRSGGYRLARPATEISVLDVVETLEGPLCLVDCVDDPKACVRVSACGTRGVWRTLTAAVRETLRATTLAAICEEQNRLTNEAVTDYNI